MTGEKHLVIIDPQADFCAPKGYSYHSPITKETFTLENGGRLYVPDAEHDISRLANMIRTLGSDITLIHVTLDSHHTNDIAHPPFWRDQDSHRPAPFTNISAEDMLDGKWTTTRAGFYNLALKYLQELKGRNRYQHTIWPIHCQMGSLGAAIMPELADALYEWAEKYGRYINFVAKGSNWKTEHYSAVVAEVPVPGDPTTDVNTEFIRLLGQADEVGFAGEAADFCLRNTFIDTVKYIGGVSFVPKMTLIKNGTSCVLPADQLYDPFVQEMLGHGMKVAETTTWLR